METDMPKPRIQIVGEFVVSDGYFNPSCEDSRWFDICQAAYINLLAAFPNLMKEIQCCFVGSSGTSTGDHWIYIYLQPAPGLEDDPNWGWYEWTRRTREICRNPSSKLSEDQAKPSGYKIEVDPHSTAEIDPEEGPVIADPLFRIFLPPKT
jgi:hypothetical protein